MIRLMGCPPMSDEAVKAASWALDQPDSAQLLAEYHSRITSAGGYISERDYDSANEWIVALRKERVGADE